jgi:Spy/CpxP family protein refolding chaperone
MTSPSGSEGGRSFVTAAAAAETAVAAAVMAAFVAALLLGLGPAHPHHPHSCLGAGRTNMASCANTTAPNTKYQL